ncbi:RsfA family transcriptional regulator [Virgibacillus siamensis]|uniref:RsfA family transcriptional regulator n=1 Tax=Virgibacillus siamensis TaxID=480071 RepID=UPI000986D47A|nr:RsfA family transcriptional regulator [Virgibacillus siamensis]
MNATRQDAWTKDEDIILAETVLRHIREGKTQLEAFKEVGKELSRTSAACGFRWNASIRKQYQDAIDQAKEERKKGNRKKAWQYIEPGNASERDPIDTAILLLERMRTDNGDGDENCQSEQSSTLKQLESENEMLKQKLKNYQEAWTEMANLWKWVEEKNRN